MVSISLILMSCFGLYILNIIIRLLMKASFLLIFLSFFILIGKCYLHTIITPIPIFILACRKGIPCCLCYTAQKDQPAGRTPKNSFQD